MWTSQGCGPSTRITLSASAVTEERSEFITRTGSPWISPSWFSQSAGYFSRRERVSASKSLDIRPLVAHEVSIKIRSDIGGHPTPMTNLGGLCLELLSGKGLESAFLEGIGLKHETVLCHHGAVFPKTPMETRTVPWLHRLRLPPRGHLPNGHNGEPSVLSRSRVRCVSFSPLKSGNKSNKPPASTVAGKGFAGHCNPSS